MGLNKKIRMKASQEKEYLKSLEGLPVEIQHKLLTNVTFHGRSPPPSRWEMLDPTEQMCICTSIIMTILIVIAVLVTIF